MLISQATKASQKALKARDVALARRARAALGAPPDDADGPTGQRGSRAGLYKIFGQIGNAFEEMLQPMFMGGGRRLSERDDDAAAAAAAYG